LSKPANWREAESLPHKPEMLLVVTMHLPYEASGRLFRDSCSASGQDIESLQYRGRTKKAYSTEAGRGGPMRRE
jgi:hypothetical protein